MSGAGWGLLDEKEEQELHKQRLLNVEEKPFKRLTKRLQTINSVAAAAARQAPTPPPENSNGNGDQQPPAQDPLLAPAALAQLKEDITLDFAAFDSSIARLQFLLTANVRERERYASDRGRILSTSQGVRDNTTELRRKLDEAKATLEQRKKFDELADKITSNRSLRPRAEQAAALKKLEEECAQLEAESEEYGKTWKARGEQFDRIMDESFKLRRQIRDEKEEVERREGMDDNDGAAMGDAEGSGGNATPRMPVSGNNTPRPDSGTVSVIGKSALGSHVEGGSGSGGGETPRPSTAGGGRTPARDVDRETPAADGMSQMLLKPRPEGLMVGGDRSRNGSQAATSREGTPRLSIETRPETPKEDVEMADGDEEESPSSPLTPLPHDMSPAPPSDTPPRVTAGEDGDDKMDTT